MRLDWHNRHARELVVVQVRYSVSRFDPVGPAEQVLAVVLAFAAAVVAEVAVEQAAFVGQVLALPQKWVRHTTPYRWSEGWVVSPSQALARCGIG